MRDLCHDGVMEWQRLAQAIVERRVGLGFDTRSGFAQHSKLSLRVLADLESASRENYDSATIARLEKSLKWPDGRVRNILAGVEDPEASPQVIRDLIYLLGPDSPVSPWDRDHIRQALEHLTQLWLSHGAMGGTPDFGDPVGPRPVPDTERVEGPRVRQA